MMIDAMMTSMNAMNKKDMWEDDTVYLMKKMNSTIILQRGDDLWMISRRIGTYLSIILDIDTRLRMDMKMLDLRI